MTTALVASAVGVGELRVSCHPEEVLVAYGLGSCVAVVAYDPFAHVAGLAHIVLPDSTQAGMSGLAAKFADTAVPALVRQMEARGARRLRLAIKLAGGAQVLAIKQLDERLRVGERNVAATRRALSALGLAPRAEDVGGGLGRTVQLHVCDGRVTVRTTGGGERQL